MAFEFFRSLFRVRIDWHDQNQTDMVESGDERIPLENQPTNGEPRPLIRRDGPPIVLNPHGIKSLKRR